MINQEHLTILLDLAGTLKRVAATNGGEYAGPCPRCGGDDRFHVQPHADNGGRWRCRQCHPEWGDAIEYICWRDGCDVSAALKTLGVKSRAPDKNAASTLPRPAPAKTWPALESERWQEQARAFVQASYRTLWTEAGEKARAWLHRRGLNDDTIQAAMLGCTRGQRADWGLEKPVWIDRGIVLPWWENGRVIRVNIRRPDVDYEGKEKEPKYRGPAGFANGLYNGSALGVGDVAVLVEGEFDALSLLQTCLDLCIPVATGSTEGARLTRWLGRLALCRAVLVAFDSDDAGENAARWWLDRLENARRLVPTRHDVNEMLQAGDDLRAWIEAAWCKALEPPPAKVFA